MSLKKEYLISTQVSWEDQLKKVGINFSKQEDLRNKCVVNKNYQNLLCKHSKVSC